jgi:hypothetical protein
MVLEGLVGQRPLGSRRKRRPIHREDVFPLGGSDGIKTVLTFKLPLFDLINLQTVTDNVL